VCQQPAHGFHLTLLLLLVPPHVVRFRKLAVQWHPDKHPEDPEGAKAKFQEINEAYTRLTTSSEDDKVEQLEQKAG
jgi:hypothetical protein